MVKVRVGGEVLRRAVKTKKIEVESAGTKNGTV